MERKDIKKLVIVFLLILVISIYVDLRGGQLSKTGTIDRNPVGGEEKEVVLQVDVDGLLDAYEYTLEVAPEQVTKEMADAYFQEAIEEIEKSFRVEGNALNVQSKYVLNLVKADWTYTPSGYVYNDGVLREEKIPKEGILLQVTVTLNCGAYETIYSFPFHLEKPEETEQEKLVSQLEENIRMQMLKEGEKTVALPKEIGDHDIKWTEKKEHITFKMFALEVVAFVLLFLLQRQQVQKEKKERNLQMELDYPEVVNQLSVLLEAGMTTRQAWAQISSQYENKKKKNLAEKRIVFEEIVMMNHRLQEGENERAAYTGFAKNIDHPLYRRLIRMLINNLEKGAKGLCEYLEEEGRQAYEQRILLAKRLGEEASTKMLLPMMIMMALVMAIVMVPALISFSI